VHLTSKDGGNAEDCREQSLPCTPATYGPSLDVIATGYAGCSYSRAYSRATHKFSGLVHTQFFKNGLHRPIKRNLGILRVLALAVFELTGVQTTFADHYPVRDTD
jgi:hypothetical protein